MCTVDWLVSFAAGGSMDKAGGWVSRVTVAVAAPSLPVLSRALTSTELAPSTRVSANWNCPATSAAGEPLTVRATIGSGPLTVPLTGSDGERTRLPSDGVARVTAGGASTTLYVRFAAAMLPALSSRTAETTCRPSGCGCGTQVAVAAWVAQPAVRLAPSRVICNVPRSTPEVASP